MKERRVIHESPYLAAFLVLVTCIACGIEILSRRRSVQRSLIEVMDMRNQRVHKFVEQYDKYFDLASKVGE